MDFSETALIVGQVAITFAHLAIACIVFALVLLMVVAVLAWRAAHGGSSEKVEALRRAAELETRLAEMAGQLRGLAEHSTSAQAHLTQTLDARLDQVSQRLGAGMSENSQRTSQSLQQLNERLAVIDTAQANLKNLSSEMLGLKDILSNKQSRGAYGQGRMEAIIRDGLHASAYSFQTTLSNGTRPDCLIRLPENEMSVVIDAKFPLEGFNALKQAGPDEDVRSYQQRFRADVAKHIKDISDRYILDGETADGALMFLPSEAVYAELHANFPELVREGFAARVWIVSPTTCMATLNTMRAILKDARMREQAGEIRKTLKMLHRDVEIVVERVDKLNTHFGQARADLDGISTAAERAGKRAERLDNFDFEELSPDEPANVVPLAKPER